VKNSISFKKAELKAYPFLSKLEVGLRGIANDESNYKGLLGSVSEIRYGDEKETENDCIVEIIMDFEEHDYADVETTNPELNGTGIDQVVMDETDMGFFFDNNPLAQTLDGKIVCPECHASLNSVSETQYEDLSWSLRDGEWVKNEGAGGSEGKKCPVCDVVLEDSETILAY